LSKKKGRKANENIILDGIGTVDGL